MRVTLFASLVLGLAVTATTAAQAAPAGSVMALRDDAAASGVIEKATYGYGWSHYRHGWHGYGHRRHYGWRPHSYKYHYGWRPYYGWGHSYGWKPHYGKYNSY